MDVSDLYIPNASKWIEFYKSGGQLKIRRKNQTGGSFISPGKTDIIPIESIKTPNTQTQITDVPVKIISPAQATVDQAKTEIDRKNKKKELYKKEATVQISQSSQKTSTSKGEKGRKADLCYRKKEKQSRKEKGVKA